jgi:hypothetical protein
MLSRGDRPRSVSTSADRPLQHVLDLRRRRTGARRKRIELLLWEQGVAASAALVQRGEIPHGAQFEHDGSLILLSFHLTLRLL